MAKQHARYSPSNLDSLSRCIRFKYKERTDDSGEEGTELHEAFETRNLAGLNEEQALAVSECLSYVDALLATEGGPSDWFEIAEPKLTLSDLTFGYADKVLINKTKPIVHVIDAKFTRVEGVHDYQVKTYAAALVEMLNGATENTPVLLEEFDECEFYYPIEQITTHVVAPRLQTVYKETYDAQALLVEIRKDIEALYEKIDDPFNDPTPNDSTCGNCARAAKCPALGKSVTALATRAGLPIPSSFAPDTLASDEDRAVAQVLAGALANWSEQVKKNNAEFAKQGGVIPGYSLRTRSLGTKIPSEETQTAIDKLVASGYPLATILQACTLSIAKMSEKYASEQEDLKKADVKEELQQLLVDITTEGTTSFLQKSKRIPDEKMLAELFSK
jgi:hypothetical protein